METMDISIRRIVITEDEDLDLDKLLLGDTSGVQSDQSTVPLPSPPLQRAIDATATCAAPQSVGQISPSRALLAQEDKGDEDGRGHFIQPTPAQPGDYLNNSVQKAPSKSILKSAILSPPSPILAEEEEGDDDGKGHWILPSPAQPGDYLNNSLHKVPSKSILKKTSSYGNFDSSTNSGGMSKKSSFLSFMDSSGRSVSSHRSNRSRNGMAPAKEPLNNLLYQGVNKTDVKLSFISPAASFTTEGTQSSIGWDLDESPKLGPRNNVLNGTVINNTSLIPPVPLFKSDEGLDHKSDQSNNTSDADVAAGMDASGSRHSLTSDSTGKMRRNVSFCSVNVREYDRTVGDNPSCRSGPPLSLDWSYSKKYENKDLEEYELERSSTRVKQKSKLHVNKYKRRNLLSFHWGHTEEELKEARRNTKKMQRQRSVTKLMLPLSMAEECFLNVKNFVIGKKSEGSERSDDWSDISSSASTKGSSSRHYRAAVVQQDTMYPKRGTVPSLAQIQNARTRE